MSVLPRVLGFPLIRVSDLISVRFPKLQCTSDHWGLARRRKLVRSSQTMQVQHNSDSDGYALLKEPQISFVQTNWPVQTITYGGLSMHEHTRYVQWHDLRGIELPLRTTPNHAVGRTTTDVRYTRHHSAIVMVAARPAHSNIVIEFLAIKSGTPASSTSFRFW